LEEQQTEGEEQTVTDGLSAHDRIMGASAIGRKCVAAAA
jgi:hypothetical protein